MHGGGEGYSGFSCAEWRSREEQVSGRKDNGVLGRGVLRTPGTQEHGDLSLSFQRLRTFPSWKETVTPLFLRKVCVYASPEADNQRQRFSIHWVSGGQQTPWGRAREAWPKVIDVARMQGCLLHRWNPPCHGRVCK